MVLGLKTLSDELIMDNEEFLGDGAPLSKVFRTRRGLDGNDNTVTS